MRWFRFYSEALHDPKVQRLPIALRWRWVEVLCLANEQPNRGTLPGTEDVAFGLRMSKSAAMKLLTSLHERGLLDLATDGTLRPHNWNGRQFATDDVTERVKKHRQGVPRNVSKSLQETPPETDTENR